jgi:RNA polymerase sigma-70 factor (ECF subfamily)
MSFDRWERVIRPARAKVLAQLLRRDFDVMTAEDAVAAAVVAALSAWPEHAPENPEAWLMSVAFRKAIDQSRRAKRLVSLDEAPETVIAMPEEGMTDERLRLYFLCTHPALDRSLQCPLMLQLVVGMTVEEIAALYLVPAPAMAQRLVRVKRKIRDAGILPRLPEPSELAARVLPVLNAIYGLYFSEWQGSPRPAQALELATTLAELLPSHAETLGLAALIAYGDSRRDARIGPQGEYVPLDEQDTGHWNVAKIEMGEAYLRKASQLAMPGRFQWEAAIQSAHIHRRLHGAPSWAMIVRVYDRLLELAPTAGFFVGRAAALAKAEGAVVALEQLEELVLRHPDLAEAFSPYLVTRAHLLRELGRPAEAKDVAQRAMELTASGAERAYLSKTFGIARGD